MDVGTAFVAGTHSSVGVEPGEGEFDVPAFRAQSGAVAGASPGDQRGDAEGADLAAVLVVVIAGSP
jgi:hypothetical protein